MSKTTELADTWRKELNTRALMRVGHAMETELRRLDAENADLRQRVAELEQQLAHGIGCFEAAEAEGLSQALAETADERLKDLVERRLMYATQAMPQPEQRVPNCTVAYIGFRWDGEAQHHIPKLVIEFSPVPANGPLDAKGWKDRDALAAMLAALSQPTMQPEQQLAARVPDGWWIAQANGDALQLWPTDESALMLLAAAPQPEQQKLKANHGSN